MKKNNFIEKVNNIGLFCKYDLIVYLLTAVIVVSLFLVFALQKNTNGLFDKIVIEKTKEETDKKCPQCGGTMAFDPKSGGMKCPYCDYIEEIVQEEV